MNNIKVSICSITYNHENYIRQALDGFLMQKTDFEYEILIHDDASTDNTAEIIREYEKKYPDIIKPIYQTENQYSKGNKPGKINRERAKGKYIALCEGDDYWIDEYKLQKQYDYMEKNEDCSLCTNSVKYVNRYGDFIFNNIHKEIDLNIEDYLKYNKPLNTCSIFTRTDFIKNARTIFKTTPVGDVPLLLYCVTKGYIHIISDIMSAYRVLSLNSWTDRLKSDDKLFTNWCIGCIKMYDDFNQYTELKYDNLIKEKQSSYKLNLSLRSKDKKLFKEIKKYDVYQKKNLREKLIINLIIKYNKVFCFLQKLKHKFFKCKKRKQ